jgi:aspartate racemase
MTISRQGMLGVIGGLGPMASTEFLRTIYEHGAGGSEQSMPMVMLVSDPTVPDRTDALRNGGRVELLDRLNTSIERLLALQCSNLVVCCVTMHALIPELRGEYRDRIISLIDVAIEEIRIRGERQLLFCSSGTRTMQVFERHPRWSEVEHLVVLPRDVDQETIHRFIYKIKRTGDADPHVDPAGSLLDHYGVQSMTVGCTEFHLLAKAARRLAARWHTCDPLETIAQQWARAKACESKT